ncbi:DEAD-box ATP-dependent RNA helicase 50 [Bienertia sinuspersici]
MYEEPDTDELDDDDDECVSLVPKDVFIKKKHKSVKSGIEQLMDNQVTRKTFEYNEILADAGSNVSANNLNGSNNRELKRSSRAESRDFKPNRKYNAGNDFFSRKSFRESGCCDVMIEALRVQSFVCPSHIQFMETWGFGASGALQLDQKYLYLDQVMVPWIILWLLT